MKREDIRKHKSTLTIERDAKIQYTKTKDNKDGSISQNARIPLTFSYIDEMGFGDRAKVLYDFANNEIVITAE